MSAYAMLAGTHAENSRKEENAAGRFSLDSAYHYYRLAEQKARLLGEPDELPGIAVGLATYWRQRSPRQSVPYFRAALDGYTRHGHRHNVVNVSMMLAGAHLALREVNSARQLLDKASREYDQYHLEEPRLLADIHSVYAELYRQTGQYRQADLYQRRASGWQMNVLHADRNGAIARLSVEFETEKRDAQIKSQQHELALRAAALNAERRVSYAGAGLLVLAAGASVVFFRLSQKARRISDQNKKLVAEQSHRIGNHLQAVSNLLSLQAIRLTDEAARQAVAESQLRVQAIGLLHRRLYDQPEPQTRVDLQVYIPELTRHVLSTHGVKTLQPRYDLAAVCLAADQTLPLGLILTEILTNACKYAFPDHPDPQLQVRLERIPDGLRVLVSDNGPGFSPVSGPTCSYGLRLIELQVKQLNGSHQFVNRAGSRFELAFPL